MPLTYWPGLTIVALGRVLSTSKVRSERGRGRVSGKIGDEDAQVVGTVRDAVGVEARRVRRRGVGADRRPAVPAGRRALEGDRADAARRVGCSCGESDGAAQVRARTGEGAARRGQVDGHVHDVADAVARVVERLGAQCAVAVAGQRPGCLVGRGRVESDRAPGARRAVVAHVRALEELDGGNAAEGIDSVGRDRVGVRVARAQVRAGAGSRDRDRRRAVVDDAGDDRGGGLVTDLVRSESPEVVRAVDDTGRIPVVRNRRPARRPGRGVFEADRVHRTPRRSSSQTARRCRRGMRPGRRA